MYPGQRIAEMFLGKTIMRHYLRTNDLDSYKALLKGDMALLKSWGQILAFTSLGPYGMAIAIALKFIPGVNINLADFTPAGLLMDPSGFKKMGKAFTVAGREIEDGFEDAYNAVEDNIKEYTNLLEDGVGQMLKNVEKLGKISAKLGKDAAKKVAGMGQEGIDKVSDLLDRLPFREVGEAIDKGIGEIGRIWGAVFGWLPF